MTTPYREPPALPSADQLQWHHHEALWRAIDTHSDWLAPLLVVAVFCLGLAAAR